MSSPRIDNPVEDDPATADFDRRMQCMEVWGGHHAVCESVAMTGLDVWVHSSPSSLRTASGGEDVYFLSSCASGRISRTLLADVSGHGSSVPHLAEELRQQMRRNINLVNQERLVTAVNQQFARTAGQQGFASGLFTTYFLPTRTLSVCAAGHPVPLIYRRSLRSWRFLENPDSEERGGRSVPLGVDENARYDVSTTRVEQDDLVFCMTDALTSSLTASGGPVGTGGLRALLQSFGELPPQEIFPAVLETLEHWHSENVDREGITAMLLRINNRKIPLKDNLLAPLRLFGGLAGLWPDRRPSDGPP
ncbi:PP2C family protein-serine/threonine phosphatase [Maioricimonas rarisocia]|nr:PP2C family protein-serine/threonine phosphatase [Maioricimonas rarisocia]